MNAFQKCLNTSDAVPLYLAQKLYLKPIAKITVSVQLTQNMMGKTITHYEIMERLRDLIKPDEFVVLKVTKTTLEIIRFEAEVEHKTKVARVVSKLDNKMIKLKDFTELMRVRAAEPKLDFPTRHDWNSYFRDAKDMNEMKPGERPDTVHISNLPTKWFVPHRLINEESVLPSEKIFYSTFEKFGSIRNVDIPICDPYRSKMKSHITGIQTSMFEETDFFEGYIQFKDYIGFSKCMDFLRGMKLLHKRDGEAIAINVYVDFDKNKHLSDASIRRRDIVRDRLVLKQKEKDDKEKQIQDDKKKTELADRQKQIDMLNEKERRRREREEKRKAKILAQLKVKESDDISDKIAREEKKLIKVQRRLEAIRLVEELFKRIKIKFDKDIKSVPEKTKKNDELTKMKVLTEHEVKTQREKLHQAIEGRVILKSIIAGQVNSDSESSSESSLISENNEDNRGNLERVYPPAMTDINWYGYLPNGVPNYNNVPQFYNPGRGFPYYIHRGRGFQGPSGRPPYTKRPYNNRGRSRGGMNHYLHQEYYKYAQNLIRDAHHYGRHISRSYSRSRSRSRSYSRHRTRTRSRSRSYTRSRSHSRSRSRYRSKSKSNNTRRSRSRRSSSSKRSTHRRASGNRSRTRSRSKQKSNERRSEERK